MRQVTIDTKPFAELLNKPEDFEFVRSSLDHTIFSSFGIIDHAIFGREVKITQSEIKRRFHICEKWFRIMRGECGFGLKRTLDKMPKALACELLDQEFDPMKEDPDHGWWGGVTVEEVVERSK